MVFFNREAVNEIVDSEVTTLKTMRGALSSIGERRVKSAASPFIPLVSEDSLLRARTITDVCRPDKTGFPKRANSATPKILIAAPDVLVG